MKPYLYLFVIILLTISLSSNLSAQENPLAEKLAGELQTLAKNSPSELAYIQTNKNIYETGEDLWFKTYLLNVQYFVPSPLSKTLYLQMFNENTKQIVWQEKYEIQNGFADGHVFLQDTLPEGSYFLVAFTQHSLFNDSSDLKTVRKIEVRKDMKPRPPITVKGKIKPNEKQPIQFSTFPEGGNLISGIQNKLAFKAVSQQGMPTDVQGTLFEDTIPLVQFKSVHAGMGSLTFTPLAGKKYWIRLSEPVTDSIFLLPLVYPQGITLHLNGKDKESLEFRVSQNSSFAKQKVYLRGQIRGIVYCIATGTLDKELKIKIPLKEFPSQGIAEFTLFSDSLVPVAERLVYINPEKKLTIEAHLDKDRYETRGKAILKIKVTDENDQPVVANLGVNVYDKLYHNPADPENILSHCFLSSQLKGRIYDPAYYFDNKNKDREEALDLLLLTQGWRRYVWGEAALQAKHNKNRPVIFDSIRGEVHATRRPKKVKGIEQFVMAFNPDKNDSKDLVMSDSAGKFAVAPLHLKLCQGGYVYLKPMAPEEFRPHISIADPFRVINGITKIKEVNYPLPALIVPKADELFNPIVEGHNAVKLAEVTVKGRGVATFRDKYIGHLDSLAKFEVTHDYVGIPCNTLNCPFHKTDRSKKPIDGKNYNVCLGKSGEILGPDWPNNYYFGDMTITYHNPNQHFTEEELLERYNLSRLKAYYVHREFYQPNYDKDPGDIQIPDFRNTLLWQPNVITDQKGEATLEFFCSDINTGFVGKIEGVSGEGLLGSKEFDFFVVKRKIANPLK
ncbi:MAG: hypothetical protein Q8928_01075 [Bacteroidota bacterium]|nr:hypothetical protein [Bacteroidota bacterium]